MKTKHSVAIFVTSIAIGAFMVWFLAGGPSSAGILAPTVFSDASEPGRATFEALKQKLYGHKLIVIGIPPQPEKYNGIVDGFVSMLAKENSKIVVLKEPQWGAISSKVQTADFDFNTDDIGSSVRPIRDAIAAGQQIVIYTVSIYSTHLIDGNAINRFEEVFHEKVPSITLGQLTLRDDGEHLNEPACVGSMRDLQGLYQLGCAQLANSRTFYKKLLPLNQKTMLLTEQAPGDYLLQLYFPN